LVSSPHQEPKTRFLLLSNRCRFLDVGCPPWREDGSVVYKCCWHSPAQSFWDPGPTGLTIVYCLVGDFHNLEFQVPILYSPRHKVAQLCP
jgi:hypothetical protein